MGPVFLLPDVVTVLSMVFSLSRFLVESPSATPGGILSHQKINCQHPQRKKI
jgi:hypothetical protein